MNKLLAAPLAEIPPFLPRRTQIGLDDLLNPVPAAVEDPDSDTDESAAESFDTDSEHFTLHSDSSGNETTSANKFQDYAGAVYPVNSIRGLINSLASCDVEMCSSHSSERSDKSRSSLKSVVMDGATKLRLAAQTILGKRRKSLNSSDEESEPPRKLATTGKDCLNKR